MSRKKGDTSNVTNTVENAQVRYKSTNTEVWLSNSLACSTEQETYKNSIGACTLVNLSTRDQDMTESQVSEYYTTDLREPLLEQF